MALVAACATVGPAASSAANFRDFSSRSAGATTRLTTPQPCSVCGVVEAPGHHELARPRRAGALGHPLGAAHQRRDADHLLDQAELHARPPTAGRRPATAPGPRSGTGRAATPASAAAGPRARGRGASRRSVSAAADCASRPSKTWTSTPAENTSPSARMSSARGRSAAARATPSSTSAISCRVPQIEGPVIDDDLGDVSVYVVTRAQWLSGSGARSVTRGAGASLSGAPVQATRSPRW